LLELPGEFLVQLLEVKVETAIAFKEEEEGGGGRE
jgi:hypothetical protein